MKRLARQWVVTSWFPPKDPPPEVERRLEMGRRQFKRLVAAGELEQPPDDGKHRGAFKPSQLVGFKP